LIFVASFRQIPKKKALGSLLFVISGILILVLLLGGFFFRYMMTQYRQSKRQETAGIASAIAYSLAMLGKHKIQQDILQDPAQPLTENLFKPLVFFEDQEKVRLDLGSGKFNLTNLANELFTSLSDAGDYSYELFYSCRKSDFSSLGAFEYCCEKEGLIQLTVSVILRKNDSAWVSEEVTVAFKVKVTSAFIPLLSKFNLYIQDSEVSTDPQRFNLVWTDQFGKLHPSSPATPWVLYCAPDDLLSIPTSLDAFIREPRGLVFLGGGKVILNIARGWGNQVELSEGFHLFFNGSRSGLYPIDWVGPTKQTAIMAWDQGICHEIEAGGNKDWWEFIKEHPLVKNQESYGRSNSIFRLFGAGNRKSPTLVLGEVYRGLISARAFKSILRPPPYPGDFLEWRDTLDSWRDYATPPVGDNDTVNIGAFCRDVGLGTGEEDLANYQKKFASKIAIQPFNISLPFIQYFHEPSPLYHFDPEFQKRMVGTSPEELFFEVPQALQIGNTSNLNQTNLDEIIAANLRVPGERTALTIDPFRESENGANPDIMKCLNKHGLIAMNPGTNEWNWNLNGWVFIDVPEGRPPVNLEFTSGIRVASNGGLVLKRGNIIIRSSILSDSGKVLQLVTLGDGDISIETDKEVHAALTSVKGTVKSKTQRSRIRGSAAMHRFDISSASQGAELQYNPLLSVNPTFGEGIQPTPNCPEKPLLAASLDESSIILR